MERNSYNRCSTGPSPYRKARIKPSTASCPEHEHQVSNPLINTWNIGMQGKGAMRDAGTPTRGGTHSARPSQASSLTHVHDLLVGRIVYATGLCSVGLCCMCPLSNAAGVDRMEWDVNGVCAISKRHIKDQMVTPPHF